MTHRARTGGRRSTPRFLAAILALQVGLAACAPAAPRPDVLLVTIDTLRADHLGCYGYGRRTSPNLDRLAAEGALFENAFTSLPRTTQSIASILTGRFPRSHGVRGLYASLPPAALTLAEVLRERGYATAAFVSNLFLRPGRGFEQGFDLYRNPPDRWDGDSASRVTTEAVNWIDALPPGRPRFLWVHYLDPHWTYDPSPPFDRAFDQGSGAPPAVYGDLRSGRLTKGQVIFRNRMSGDEIDRLVALYDGEIAQTDAALGLLLGRLARSGERPTLTLVTSDHGESLGEHDYFFAHGEYLYHPTLRIPLLIALPGVISKGVRIGGLAGNIDIAPTILGLLGIDRMQGVEGRPLFRPGTLPADPAPGRPVYFAESDYQLIHEENPRYHIPGPAGRWSSAFDLVHKLIQIPRPGGPSWEFYDLAADPRETRALDGRSGPDGPRSRLWRELHGFADYAPGPALDPSGLPPEDRDRLRSLGYIN